MHKIREFNDFMEFLNDNIYKAAIDYAREKNHPDVVDLLSQKAEMKKSDENKDKPSETSDESDPLKIEIRQLKEKIAQIGQEKDHLKDLLFSLKEESHELQFFNFSDYNVQTVIGEGATSCVKLVVKNEKFAMKELKGSDFKTMQRFLGEGEVLFLLHHPCILDIIACNYGDDSHPPSLILSLEPTSLEASISKNELDEIQKCKITVELVLGMRYIHRRNYMHRDLKPSNILLSKDGHVRISDFGLAKEESLDTSQSKGVGTLRFMAPELFAQDEDSDTHYTNKVDVYSFGITLVYIVTGNYPKFNMRNAVIGVLPPLPDTIVSWVRELIISCLSFDPENRPSFAEIFETLKANNYDLFSENKDQKLTTKQQNMKKEIEERVLKIEAFEFQHQKQ